jgi:hypothetical protein
MIASDFIVAMIPPPLGMEKIFPFLSSALGAADARAGRAIVK